MLTGLHVAYVYTAAGLVLMIASMAYAYWENLDFRVRPRIKAVVPGAILAAGVQAFIFLNNALGGRDLPVQFGLLAPTPYYLSIAYAIARHDLFDIDRVVRLSFVYAVLSVIVIAAYAGALQLSTFVVPVLGGGTQTLVGILFVLLLAFALDPLRQGVQNVVDRALYRKRLDYRATISELSTLMTTLLDLQEVATQVTRVVVDAMQLETIAVGLVDDADSDAVWHRSFEGAMDQTRHPGVGIVVRCVEGDTGGLGACVEVQITDNGDGIDPRHLGRIFEPFFSTKPIGKGTGLGLSIAYGAVKSQGGTIGVDSQVGHGTTVTVRLPLSRRATDPQ